MRYGSSWGARIAYHTRIPRARQRQRAVKNMNALTPFNLRQWIDRHRADLRPPVGNKRVFRDSEFIVMVVGGPNSRKDFHVDPGEEFFYQLEGGMLLRVVRDGRIFDVPIREGEVLLLPGGVPHSPQRFADTVGLVVERERRPGELDGLQWYCERCSNLLYEERFELRDIETQFPPVFARFFASAAHRTCRSCGAVMEPPS
jgi:3-hydroxyanthranilate 3,4-dioxygenase